MRTCCLLLLTAAAATRTGDDLHSTRASVVLSPQNSCLIRTDRQTDGQPDRQTGGECAIGRSINQSINLLSRTCLCPPPSSSFIHSTRQLVAVAAVEDLSEICTGIVLSFPVPAVVAVVQRDSFIETEELRTVHHIQ